MDERLEAQVGALLRARKWMICAAESCTGGLVMHRLTNIAGSSDYVIGGVVAYSNEIKEHVLRVSPETLMTYGAVSIETAAEMAQGALALFGADIAVSVTGIAGPGGGTSEKPVGLTYIGLAKRGQASTVQKHIWGGSREENKAASAEAVLRWLMEILQ
jgi:nicotinamide-nucleotide amidase